MNSAHKSWKSDLEFYENLGFFVKLVNHKPESSDYSDMRVKLPHLSKDLIEFAAENDIKIELLEL